MEVATLYPTKDTYLAEVSSELGGNATIACGQISITFPSPVVIRNRLLISFDLSAYAATTIYSAVLRLTLIQAFFPDGPHELTAHELTKDWTEGEESWTEASDGDNWASQGGDFNATPFASSMISNGATSLEISLAPLARQRRGGPINCLLKLPEGTGHNNHYFTCHSREATLQVNRPTLTIQSIAGVRRCVALPARRQFAALPRRRRYAHL
jgi:hypothetical protein